MIALVLAFIHLDAQASLQAVDTCTIFSLISFSDNTKNQVQVYKEINQNLVLQRLSC